MALSPTHNSGNKRVLSERGMMIKQLERLIRKNQLKQDKIFYLLVS